MLVTKRLSDPECAGVFARWEISEKPMGPLLVSGLFCVPAVIMLCLGWTHNSSMRAEDAIVAATPMAVASRSSPLTVSLPSLAQREPQQMDLDAWKLVWVGSLTAEPTRSEPALSHPRSVRTLHARASAARPTSPVIETPTTFSRQTDTVWTPVVQWLTRHEAGKMWSPADTQGAG
jgi:hypothetical protein